MQKKKRVIIILGTILSLLISFLAAIILKTIFNAPKTYEEKIADKQNEEEIIPIYKVYIPKVQDNCSTNRCITKDNYKVFFEYIQKNYPLKYQNNRFFITKGEEYIELVKSSNDEEKIDEKDYKYIIDKTMTLDDIKEIITGEKKSSDTNINKSNAKATQIAVLNYHFFYDKNTETCAESICIDIANFEKQLQYLKNNNYKTLTIEEFKEWMYGEKEFPQKSVLITIDDGAMGTGSQNGNKLIPLLEKYQIHATLFLITGWWNKSNYQSPYLDVESHSDRLHYENFCEGISRGAKMLCLSREEIKSDLEASIKKLETHTAFCFPYYLSDSKSIEVLKELDFKIAFIGGNKKATRSDNKYKIPRYVVYKNTSLDSFIKMIS